MKATIQLPASPPWPAPIWLGAVFVVIFMWWRPWEVPAFHGRYIALKLLLLRVQVLKACYLVLLRLKYASALLVLYAKWSKPFLHLRYLLFKRFIHKLRCVGYVRCPPNK